MKHRFSLSPHISLVVPDPMQAMEYFCEVFGAELVSIRREKGDIHLRLGGFNFYLEQGDSSSAILEFCTDDLAGAKSDFLARGCTVEPTQVATDTDSVMVTDAFGLTYHVLQRPSLDA